MNNSASKCLKITLKVYKFSKPEKNFRLRGDIPLELFEEGLIPHLPSGGNPGGPHLFSTNMPLQMQLESR
jgi:hypothetical protein